MYETFPKSGKTSKKHKAFGTETTKSGWGTDAGKTAYPNKKGPSKTGDYKTNCKTSHGNSSSKPGRDYGTSSKERFGTGM